MSTLGRVRAWGRAVLFRGRAEREMRQEMAVHIARATERFRARGMSESEADAAARREFGQIAGVEEQSRDMRGGALLHGLGEDVKYAFRYFARTPLATITIVLTLAFGIGVSSAIFSVLDGLTRRPAPFVPNDPALVKIRGISNPPLEPRLLSYEELAADAALTGEFASVAAWTATNVVVDDANPDAYASAALAHVVTPNYFRALGITPAAGRFFVQSRFEDLAPPEFTAVVSYAMATARLGGVEAAIGKHLTINELSFTVVGVMPDGFRGVIPRGDWPMLWLPLSCLQALWNVNSSPLADPDAALFEALARMQPGIRMSDASNSVRLVATNNDRAARARADHKWTGTADLVRLRGFMDVRVTEHSNEVWGFAMFTTLTMMILLMCSTTVSSLLVGAAVTRRHEIGVRLALGASRARIVRQLLTETTILSVVGGALGLAAFAALCKIIEAVRAGFDVVPSWPSVAFTLVCAMFAATLSGLSPALHATRSGLTDALRTATGVTRRSRLQRAFVVAQIAISMPMLVALSTQIGNVMRELPPTNNGAARERVLVAHFETRVGPRTQGPDLIPELAREIARLPGVVEVLPMSEGTHFERITRIAPATRQDRVEEPRSEYVDITDVPPGYFTTLGIPIARGREFTATDTTMSVTPIVVDKLMAAEWFPGTDPIGHHVFQVVQDGERAAEFEIVGVAGIDREGNYPVAFAPFKRRREGTLFIHTAARGDALVPAVVALAHAQARSLPLTRVQTLASEEREKRHRVMQVIGGGAGAGSIALILAAIGLYAVVTVAVGQRFREIGVRLALGARPRTVVAGFFTDGLRTTLLGVVVGVPLSLGGVDLLVAGNGLHGQDKTPLCIAVVSLTVTTVAMLASWIPARRAAGVDPVIALRAE